MPGVKAPGLGPIRRKRGQEILKACDDGPCPWTENSTVQSGHIPPLVLGLEPDIGAKVRQPGHRVRVALKIRYTAVPSSRSYGSGSMCRRDGPPTAILPFPMRTTKMTCKSSAPRKLDAHYAPETQEDCNRFLLHDDGYHASHGAPGHLGRVKELLVFRPSSSSSMPTFAAFPFWEAHILLLAVGKEQDANTSWSSVLITGPTFGDAQLPIRNITLHKAAVQFHRSNPSRDKQFDNFLRTGSTATSITTEQKSTLRISTKKLYRVSYFSSRELSTRLQ
ncbi:hypothetical protein GE09DRAFT_766640 [Coniochaeta sp. 2T2.1]|nr:hypothetical protein GE09DRAFT_766640 [Coniochaeta sp. 2T2.1]